MHCQKNMDLAYEVSLVGNPRIWPFFEFEILFVFEKENIGTIFGTVARVPISVPN